MFIMVHFWGHKHAGATTERYNVLCEVAHNEIVLCYDCMLNVPQFSSHHDWTGSGVVSVAGSP